MARPKAVVLMPAYNQDRYIAQAIHSVLTQVTNFPFELWIGDDASTDGTRPIAEQYYNQDKRVKLIGHHTNKGLAHNLSVLWDSSDSDYIAMLEADDLWCSRHKLQTQVDLMEKNPDMALCFTKTHLMDTLNAKPRRDSWPYRPVTKPVGARDILRRNLIANCSVLYRRQFKLSDYPWLLGLPYCDIALHALHAMSGSIGYVPQTMAIYRLHAQSAFEQKSLRERLRLSAVVYETLVERLPKPYSDYAQQTLAVMYTGLGLLTFEKTSGRWECIPLAAEQVYHLLSLSLSIRRSQ